MKRLFESMTRLAAVLAAPGFLCATAALLRAQTLEITSPADGTVVNPGQTFAVTVSASGANFQMVVVIGQDPIGDSQWLTAPPYHFSIRIPSRISPRRYTLTADGATTPGQGATSPPIWIDVERPDAPVSVKVDPSLLIMRVGDPGYLFANATYADGTTEDVSQSTLTRWSSDSPNVASVTDDGRVTATGSGSARITVENGGRRAVVTVTVTDRKPAGEPKR